MKKRTTKLICISMAVIMTLSALAGCTSATFSKKTVSTDGSTSMELVIGILGEHYMYENENINFTYNPTGSSAGISAVVNDRCDIGLSSRALNEEEINKGLRETTLAYDGIAVIVHPENTVSDISLDTLKEIYTGSISNWKELGGTDSEIVLIGREAGSGTRDGFETTTGTEHQCKYRQELTSSGDVITTVKNNPNAIGYTSLASLKDSVKAVTIGGIQATELNIRDGSYVIQRPFNLITKEGGPLSPEAKEFMDFALSSESTEYIRDAGVVPAR